MGGTRPCLEELPWEEDEELSPQEHMQLWSVYAPAFLKHSRLGVPQKTKPTPKKSSVFQLGKFSGNSITEELLKTRVTQSYMPAGSLK